MLKELKVFIILFSFLGSFLLPNNISAQTPPDIKDKFRKIWPLIESQLDEKKNDSLKFVKILIEGYCEKDYTCSYALLEEVKQEIEKERFDLPKAILIGKMMLNLARKNNKRSDMGHCYLDISRYYDALKNTRIATQYLDSTLIITEELGDYEGWVENRMWKLERILAETKKKEILLQMDSLLKSVNTDQYPALKIELTARMINHKLYSELYDDAAQHLSDLEKLVFANDSTSFFYRMEFHRMKARLYELNKDFTQAKSALLKALELAITLPDKWREVYILQNLAKIEWTTHNSSLAKNYINKAILKADSFKMHDLQVSNYQLKMTIAEEENDYKAAYLSLQQIGFHTDELNARSGDFDLENYYLALEKEQLAVEKKNRDLELSLKNTQLRNSTIIGMLLSLLAIISVVAFFRQRHRRRALLKKNEIIQQQKEELANLDKAKSKFYANVSHELRTPLTLLVGPINSVIKNGNLNEHNLNLMKKAQKSCGELLSIVRSILDLSKMEANKIELDEELEHLHPIINRIVYAFESHAETNGINYSLTYQARTQLHLMVDKAKLETIINNYLTNALKFTEPNGQVAVTVKDTGNHINIAIADTGRGIHPDDIPHIFNRFYQSKRAEAPTEGGTGIGLSLVKELANLMGGKVWVESEFKKGSTFYLEIPKKEAQMIEAINKASTSSLRAADYTPESTMSSQQMEETNELPYILVVEDNHSIREYIISILATSYHVLSAENGQKALRVLNEVPNCQLLLSDIMMPVMDGYQLLSTLKKEEKFMHLPVIMLTARGGIRDKLKALRIGVDDYMLKPFDEEELLVRIQNLLDNQKERTQAQEEELIADAKQVMLAEKDQTWLEDFESYVRVHLEDELMNIPSLAAHFAMSESTLLRQLKRLTGLSPHKYLQEMRLDQARQLLEESNNMTIAQIAAKVGYKNMPNFSRSFKKRYGQSPSAYIK